MTNILLNILNFNEWFAENWAAALGVVGGAFGIITSTIMIILTRKSNKLAKEQGSEERIIRIFDTQEEKRVKNDVSVQLSIKENEVLMNYYAKLSSAKTYAERIANIKMINNYDYNMHHLSKCSKDKKIIEDLSSYISDFKGYLVEDEYKISYILENNARITHLVHNYSAMFGIPKTEFATYSQWIEYTNSYINEYIIVIEEIMKKILGKVVEMRRKM